VPIVTQRNGRPLFAFHPAGGEVMAYHSLAACLGQSVIGVQSRAVGGAQPEHQRLEGMAADYAHAIIERQPKGPYRLLGWSMGGVLAMNVARLLEDGGERVSFVGLLDSHAPDVDEEPDPLLVPAVALADALAGLDRIDPAEIDELRRRLRGKPLHERLREVIAWAGTHQLLVSDRPLALLERQAELAAVHERLMLAHRLPLINADVTVWWAEDDLDHGHRRTAWRRYTWGAVREESLPGNHFTMLRPPNVSVAAKRIRAALRHHLPLPARLVAG
jgi:thioesterase domain-containing protein